jgi:hypothetical protein
LLVISRSTTHTLSALMVSASLVQACDASVVGPSSGPGSTSSGAGGNGDGGGDAGGGGGGAFVITSAEIIEPTQIRVHFSHGVADVRGVDPRAFRLGLQSNEVYTYYYIDPGLFSMSEVDPFVAIENDDLDAAAVLLHLAEPLSQPICDDMMHMGTLRIHYAELGTPVTDVDGASLAPAGSGWPLAGANLECSEHQHGLACTGYALSEPQRPERAGVEVSCQVATSCGATCDGQCVDTDSDSANCGFCGRGCGGGACVDGTCAPETLASQVHGAHGQLALDALRVCYTSFTVNDPETDADRVACAPLAGGTEVVLASAETRPTLLALRNQQVYWVSGFGTLEIKTAPADGSAPPAVLHATSDHVWGLAVNDTHVYFPVGGQGAADILRMPVGGGPVETVVVAADSPRAVALNGTHLFFVTEEPKGKLMKVPLAGGLAEDALPGVSPNALHLLAGGNHVYFDAGPHLFQVPAAGGPFERVGTVPGGLYTAVTALAADDVHVYWGDRDGRVFRRPHAGGPARVLSRGQELNFVTGLAVDTTGVYFVRELGKIQRIPK